ncbi:MAG: hypothetical protein AB1768_20035 [Pseudomonadota bacterium]
MSVLTGIRAALVVLTIAGAAGCTAEKDRLDAEVRRLCALDGGIKVYEKVGLPPERFDKYGSVTVPDRRLAKPTDEYFTESKHDVLVKGNPELWRSHTALIRQRDHKVLAESVHYWRRGGDLPGPWQPSVFTCPELSGIGRSVFFKVDASSEKERTK